MVKRNLILLVLIGVTFACSTTKKKGELSKIGKLYHNTTSRYNGYFNAQELLKKSKVALAESNQDNYDELLNVYAYQTDNPEVAYEELNLAIEKVATVVQLHRNSKWVDDCYLLLGQAQYLKQDFESAEETFRFFQEEFDARNIYPTNNLGGKQSAKEERKYQNEIKREKREEEKKVKEEEKTEAKKTRDEERKDSRKAREDLKKEETKLKKTIKKLKNSLKKAEKNRKLKEKKAKDKARKQKKRLPKVDPNVDRRSTKEIELEGKIKAAEAELKSLRPKKKEEEAKVKEEKPEEVIDEESKSANEENGKEEEEEEEQKEEEEIDEKEDFSPEGLRGGIFKHKPAYYEGMLWLARTYAERDNAFSSEHMLNNLKAESQMYKNVKNELPASFAHLYIKQKNYPKAVVALNEAIESSSDKYDKARYAYIIGQLYEQKGQTDDALIAFERSKKFRPKYEMQFHANLKEIILSHETGRLSQKKALSRLDKMLKEDKNIDFGGELHTAKGEIYLGAGNELEAIASFGQALQNQNTSKNKKADLYYKLASLFYDTERYLEASSYYDSTLQVLNKESERYSQVERRAKNLQDVAKNIQIIQLQDSLLALANMSEEDQQKVAKKIYEQRKEEGVKSGPPSLEETANGLRNEIVRRVGNERSNFFAYNPVGMAQGQRDFKRKWGSRQLEDDWRRSARTGASFDIVENEIEEEVDEEVLEGELMKIIAEIPNSPVRKKAAIDAIEKARYELGVAYRNDVGDFEKSAKTLDAFLTDYQSSDKKSEVYYYQYLNYIDLRNKSKADGYANRLKTEYPESIYSKILFDPNYIKSFEEESDKEELTYTKTFDLFQNKEYAQVIRMSEDADKEFGKDNMYAAKYALLEAMSKGNIEGRDEYIKSLKSLTKRFPNTIEQIRASEILRFLDGKGDAFTSSLLEEEDLQAFKMEPDKLHYGVVVLYNAKDGQVNESKVSISNYHKKYFRLDKLKITSVHLNRDEKTEIVLVRKFRNKERADLYFKSISAKSDEYLTEDVQHEFFVITQRNYRELLKQKSPVGYMHFFDQNYK